jgi:hypothetical protein
MLISELLKNREEDLEALLSEATLELPANLTLPELMDEAYKRFTAARQALGISNKLKDADQRKKHQSRVLKAINGLRKLLDDIARGLGYDKD